MNSTLTLYGADIDIATDYPTKAVVLALAGVVSYQVNFLNMEIGIETKNKFITGLDNKLYNSTQYKQYRNYSIKMRPLQHPNTNVDIKDMFPLERVLYKKFLWLLVDMAVFKIDLSREGNSTALGLECVPVVSSGLVSMANNKGLYPYNLKLRNRNPIAW